MRQTHFSSIVYPISRIISHQPRFQSRESVKPDRALLQALDGEVERFLCCDQVLPMRRCFWREFDVVLQQCLPVDTRQPAASVHYSQLHQCTAVWASANLITVGLHQCEIPALQRHHEVSLNRPSANRRIFQVPFSVVREQCIALFDYPRLEHTIVGHTVQSQYQWIDSDHRSIQERL